MPQQSISRRRLLKQVAGGLVLIPLVNLPQHVIAAEKITLDHPSAKALGYVHVAEDTDVAKYPKRAGAEGATQFCDNCLHYKPTEDEWGTCNLFPNYLVAAKGWCNAWVVMP